MKDYEMGDQPIQIPLGLFLEIRDELFELRKLKEEKEQQDKTPSEDRTLIVDIEFLKANSLNGYTPDEPLIGDRVQEIINETIKSKQREQLVVDCKVALKKAILELINAQIDFEKFSNLPYFKGVALVDLYDMLVTVSSKGDSIDIKSYRGVERDKELLKEVGEQLLNKRYKVHIKPLYSLEEDKVFCYRL